MQSQQSTAKPGVSGRFAFGCLTLFGSLFALGGVFALWQGIKEYRTKPDSIVPLIVGGIFTLVGLLVIIGAWYAATASAKQDTLKAQNPGMPWMWREDWARGSVKDTTKP